MASRKEQKEAARQRRLEEERLRAEQARRTRRLQMLGGMVIVVVAVIVVVIAVSSSGSSSGILKPAQAGKTEQQITALLAGIPQSGQTLGKTNAPVTMTYYGDLECPICKDFTLSSFPQLVSNEVKAGKVKVVYKSFCTATCNGPGQSVFNTQQAAAYAAGQQNKFWDYAELFYHEQGTEGTGYVNQGYLNTLAEQTPGLSLSKWKSASGASSLVSQVGSDENSATALGVTGTPTLFFKGPKGQVSASSVPTYSELQQDIQQVS
jgi:protein-disulfide isomerase